MQGSSCWRAEVGPAGVALGNTWSYLDMTALGRQELWEDSPEGYPQTPTFEWWKWHDEYGVGVPTQEWLAQTRRGTQAQHR